MYIVKYTIDEINNCTMETVTSIVKTNNKYCKTIITEIYLKSICNVLITFRLIIPNPNRIPKFTK